MKSTLVTAALALSIFCLGPNVRADEWNQQTQITFNQPVEIPGRVLLPGTYIFKLASSNSDRNIVEVYNDRQNHLYGIFLTIPDYRATPAGHVIVKFAETTSGSPDALSTWFYPGDNYGHEFVYPRSEAVRLAKSSNRPVPFISDEIANQPATSMNDAGVAAMNQAHVKAMTPNGEEVECNTVFGRQTPVSH